jgi:two-component system chemotaxis response regulator CheB
VALHAPGGRHLATRRGANGAFIADVYVGAPVGRHRPSVDVLFASVAEAAGARGVGVILTGMGEDGARGLGRIRLAGGATIAQDEATSVVYGMPKAAVDAGVVNPGDILPLGRIPEAMLRAAARPR